MANRRVFNVHEKARIALEIMGKKKTYEEASRDYQISESRLESWVETFIENGMRAFDDEAALEKEETQLERQLFDLTRQNEVYETARRLLLYESLWDD